MRLGAMTMRGAWRTCALALAAAAGPAVAAPAEAPVRSLIVQLHGATPHALAGGAPGVSAREHAMARAAAAQDDARWRTVLQATGLGAEGAVLLRPVGRDQQVLEFSQPIPAAQARALAQRLGAQRDVAAAELNTRERRLQVPNDEYFPQQWWLAPVSGTDANALPDRRRGVAGFQSAWQRFGAATLPSAVVAVVDTGITAHPDLAGKILPGYDFVHDPLYGADGNGRDADPTDPGDFVTAAEASQPGFAGCTVDTSSWHGTVIAGLIAAVTNNGTGVAGLHWTARVLPVRVAGKCGADVADIIEGMRWAAGLPACQTDDGAGHCLTWAPANPNPARIINISFGGTAACGTAYQTTVDELRAVGAVVVAAAGNEHQSTPTRPASCNGVIGVAGLARDGYKAHYSNFGAALADTGIATVAGDDNADTAARWNALADDGILTLGNYGDTTLVGPYYFSYWGTSFSAPLVAGTLGLMLSVNPALTAGQMIDGLRRSARPHVTSSYIGACSAVNPGRCLCTTATCGAGILDAEQAMVYASNPAAYVAPARQPAVINAADVAALAAAGPDRAPNPGAVPPTPPTSSGGGGALAAGWLAGLLLATTVLQRRRRGAR